MSGNLYVCIAVMSLVSLAVRAAPLTVIRRPVRSVFLRSFLHYVPYVTLAVMTFPAILDAAGPLAGGLALLAGTALAWRGKGLFPVAAACCAAVLLAGLLPI